MNGKFHVLISFVSIDRILVMLLSTKDTLVPLCRYSKLISQPVTELYLIQRCPFSLHMALIRQLNCGGKRSIEQ
jgi:hypothetical protein